MKSTVRIGSSRPFPAAEIERMLLAVPILATALALASCSSFSPQGPAAPARPNLEVIQPRPLFGEEARSPAPGAAEARASYRQETGASGKGPLPLGTGGTAAAGRSSEQPGVKSAVKPAAAGAPPLPSQAEALRAMGASAAVAEEAERLQRARKERAAGSAPAATTGTGSGAAAATASVPSSSSPSTSPPARGQASTVPRPSGESGDRAPDGGGDPFEAAFRKYQERWRDLAARGAGDAFADLQAADLEGKLIALFFLRENKDLEDYRELFRSLRDEAPGNVEQEILKGAFFQRVGQADLRDRALERARLEARPGAVPAAASLRLAGLAFAQEIRGYRSFTLREEAEFRPGEEVLIYSEITGFKSTPAAGGGTGSVTLHRRSFAVDLVLLAESGKELDRRVLLQAGKAVEMAAGPADPVYFWGRYPLAKTLAAGKYRLEVEAEDLEGKTRTRALLPFTVR